MNSHPKKWSAISWVLIGPVVTLIGALSYFLFFAYFADLRDVPWVNLPWVALGMLISGIGLWRAHSGANLRRLSKVLAVLGFLFSLGIGGLFFFYIFDYSYRVPARAGVSDVAERAPDFALPNQDNQIVRSSDFAGKSLVLVFYRGYW